MNVLVTGADGFVGSWLLPRLREEGHATIAAVRPGCGDRLGAQGIPVVPLEVTEGDSVARALEGDIGAVVHLAAVASGADAAKDPGYAWLVNAVGTARLAEALARKRAQTRTDPVFLLVSTGEVYGHGPETPRTETDPTHPLSPYAASKLGGEIAALEVHRRTRLRVVVARAFPHSGRGQDQRFVIPALARRLVLAKRVGAPAVEVGNLDVVRDFMHVSDVVDAYARLLTRGEAGTVYNVATGQGVRLSDVFRQLGEIIGHAAVPEVSSTLVRPVDLNYLVGDGARLRRATGWSPRVSLRDMLAEVAHAQAD